MAVDPSAHQEAKLLRAFYPAFPNAQYLEGYEVHKHTQQARGARRAARAGGGCGRGARVGCWSARARCGWLFTREAVHTHMHMHMRLHMHMHTACHTHLHLSHVCARVAPLATRPPVARAAARARRCAT